LKDIAPSPDLPLLNLSQAAPALAPPEPLRQAMAEMVLNEPAAHLYGPDLGYPPLREALADNISSHYQGEVGAEQVAITAGCNQAYTAAIATLVAPGDEVILPTPWYFNHQMWLTTIGVQPVPLPCGPDLRPDPELAAQLITPKTRAIALVSPNNPCGVEHPPALIQRFYALAQEFGLALILDETYRDFHGTDGPPHALFQDPNWPETLIHLYSFSKAYRLTGHRVGAIVTHPDRLVQVEKFLDSTTICAPQLGQRAAAWGLKHLQGWLAEERAEILDRRAAISAVFQDLPGWTLRGVGAYFAYVDHPGDMHSTMMAQHLLHEQRVLALPGAFFAPRGDPAGAQSLRIAFANADLAGIAELHTRLTRLSLAPS
jgi:aspartate/methionine/tyrosine aminotransferase